VRPAFPVAAVQRSRATWRPSVVKTSVLLFPVLLAAASVAPPPTAASDRCAPDAGRIDPSLSLEVLVTNGYRIVTSQALSSPDGAQAVETVATRGNRTVRCRTDYGPDSLPGRPACYVPCQPAWVEPGR